MILRVAVLLMAASLLALSSTAASEPPITGTLSGAATYQLVAGETATVVLSVGNLSRGSDRVVFRFTGRSNWLRDHTPVTVDSPACTVTNFELDCVDLPAYWGASITEWPVRLTGVARRHGESVYTVHVFHESGNALEPIGWPNREPLIVSWVERVVAP